MPNKLKHIYKLNINKEIPTVKEYNSKYFFYRLHIMRNIYASEITFRIIKKDINFHLIKMNNIYSFSIKFI